MKPEKTLYYFNILHSDDEIGRETSLDKGRYESIWKQIITEVESLSPLPTKMYNDSLWIEDPRIRSYTLYPPESVPKVLDSYGLLEGYNRQVLVSLAQKGASLVPCENKELLAEFYRLQEELKTREKDGKLSNMDHARHLSIVLRRNLFIAQQIGESLDQGEFGVLLLGYLHNYNGVMVNQLRDAGISVTEFNPDVRG